MQKVFVVMVGLPRSGKSERAKKLSLELAAPIVSPDFIRLTLHGHSFYWPAEPMVWGIAKTMVQVLFMTGHQYVIFDACNRTRAYRDDIRRAAPAGVEVRFLSIVTTKDVCLTRTDDEDLKATISRMAASWEYMGEDEIPYHDNEFENPKELVVTEWMENEGKDLKTVCDHCSEVYMHFSEGAISNPMTYPSEVISIADELERGRMEEALKEAKGESE